MSTAFPVTRGDRSPNSDNLPNAQQYQETNARRGYRQEDPHANKILRCPAENYVDNENRRRYQDGVDVVGRTEGKSPVPVIAYIGTSQLTCSSG